MSDSEIADARTSLRERESYTGFAHDHCIRASLMILAYELSVLKQWETMARLSREAHTHSRCDLCGATLRYRKALTAVEIPLQ